MPPAYKTLRQNLAEVGDSLGFHVWTRAPQPMPDAHSHVDLEWNLVHSGSLRYFIAGRFATLSAGQLGVFWGGIPHRLIEFHPDTRLTWVTLPLPWFMQWNLDRTFTARLLQGEMLSTPSNAMTDESLLSRWEADLNTPNTNPLDTLRTIMLEVEARLRRHARALTAPAKKTRRLPATDHSSHAVERLAKFMGERYRDDLSVTDIAAAVNLHPNYAMQLFSSRCGMSIWEYLIRLRLSHAQRLLLMTDEKVTRIALDSGFNSPNRFYAAFSRVVRQTPRQYRLTQRGERPTPTKK